MNKKKKEKSIGNIGHIFFVLWLISLVSDVLGQYEYKKEFLILAVAFWTASSFVDRLRKRRSISKKVTAAFRKSGTTLFGLWIFLYILKLLGWLETWWDTYLIYILGISILMLVTSLIVKASTSRRSHWQLRSSLYTIGGLILFVWVVLRLQGAYVENQDTIFVISLACIAVGFLIGAYKKEYDYDFITEKIEEFKEEWIDVTDKHNVSEDVKVLTDNIFVGNNASVNIKKGALCVDVFKNDKQSGTVYFGEGSYHIETPIHTFDKEYMGLCYGHGKEWKHVSQKKDTQRASEEDFKRFGLSAEDVKELTLIFSSESPDATEKFEDLLAKLKTSKTEISLPFFKVLECEEGDYVKIGPIQVADIRGNHSRVRIGGKEYVDSKTGAPSGEEPEGIAFKIRTVDETVALSIEEDTLSVYGKDMTIEIDDTDALVEANGIKYEKDAKRERLETPDVNITLKKSKLNIRTDKFELTINDNMVSMRNKDRHVERSDKQLAKIFEERVRAQMPHIADDAIQNSRNSLDELISQLSENLGL
ncbi:MAG: hypothetical protein ACXQTP_03595 [Candidatus Methanofastidiosia archaeon]